MQTSSAVNKLFITPLFTDAPLKGTPLNIRINIVLPETKSWATFSIDIVNLILIQIHVIGSERNIPVCIMQYDAYGPFNVIQCHCFWYKSNAYMKLPISE